MQIGYCRTSTVEQVAGLEAQQRKLLATGCTKLFVEQVSSVAYREKLASAMDFVREGDVLMVTDLDRLARSTSDLLKIVARLEEKGVGLKILNFAGSEVDTKSPSGKMLLTMVAAVAQFEIEIGRQRQKEGIAKAKAQGKYRGRAPTARRLAPQVHELRASGLGACAIATRLKVSRSSVYRILADRPA